MPSSKGSRKKEMKGIYIKKKEMKLSMLIDDMISYGKNLKELTKNY